MIVPKKCYCIRKLPKAYSYKRKMIIKKTEKKDGEEKCYSVDFLPARCQTYYMRSTDEMRKK